MLVRNFVGYEPPKEAPNVLEFAKTAAAITGNRKAKSKDRAPLYIQQMIADSKKKAEGK